MHTGSVSRMPKRARFRRSSGAAQGPFHRRRTRASSGEQLDDGVRRKSSLLHATPPHVELLPRREVSRVRRNPCEGACVAALPCASARYSSSSLTIRASTAFVTSSARSGACDSGELLVSELHANSTYNRIRGSSMSKTPTEELEGVTMRLPSPLLDRVRKDSEERGRPFAHSIRAALEIFFFHNVAREMAQTMTDDMKELGLNREDYFRSLLDARYRQLIATQALAVAKKGPAKRG